MTDEAIPQQPAVETPAPVETPAAPESPVSMDDTIRETYKALREPKKETPEQPEGKPQERKRDAQGRFLKADGTPEEPTPEGERATSEGDPEGAQDTPPASAWPEAPKSWTKDAQEAYAALPENIKAEIHRREGDFHKGIEQYKQMAHVGQTLDKEIRPYAELIQQHGTTAQNVVRELLATQKQLTTGTAEQKAQVVAKILRDYQIDTNAVNQALQQPAPAQPDPHFSQLADEVNQLKSQLSQAQLAPYIEQVNKFASDPANEFYPIVEEDMNALLAQGRATDLKDAYNKAIWANPETRAKLLAKQQEGERRKAAETAAAAKKAGSTNVERRGTAPQAPANGTMEDTIRAEYRRLNG